MIIYHNPRCRKSRETLQLIHNQGIEPEIIEYLNDPLSAEQLGQILKKLDLRPEQIIRKGEDIFKENFKGQDFSDQEWLQISRAASARFVPHGRPPNQGVAHFAAAPMSYRSTCILGRRF